VTTKPHTRPRPLPVIVASAALAVPLLAAGPAAATGETGSYKPAAAETGSYKPAAAVVAGHGHGRPGGTVPSISLPAGFAPEGITDDGGPSASPTTGA
jgi:hypothetical protein